ncbi:hypothetical protein LY76DRAFT_685554 [Colletotrichum caudatum]|nr:hypothetical protein LY76DRAFT_685554 [Colletotrichum caudatum]
MCSKYPSSVAMKTSVTAQARGRRDRHGRPRSRPPAPVLVGPDGSHSSRTCSIARLGGFRRPRRRHPDSRPAFRGWERPLRYRSAEPRGRGSRVGGGAAAAAAPCRLRPAQEGRHLVYACDCAHLH